MKERFVFVLETEIHTFRRKFDSQSLTAKKIFEELKKLKDASGPIHYQFGDSDISISDIDIVDGYAIILFRLADGKIPDNRFLNRKTRALRDAPRKNDEAPAVSAHFIIDLNDKHATKRTYPTAIENAEHLSKTLILSFINRILKESMSTSKEWTSKSGKKEMKPFYPRLAYQANYRNTINGILDRNGAIVGIEYADEKIEEITMGSAATAVRAKRGVKLVPETKPKGDAARDFVNDVFSRGKAKKAKTAKIIIEDPDHGKPKVVTVGKKRADALKSAFIPQKIVKGISPELKVCEDTIHENFAARMIGLL